MNLNLLFTRRVCTAVYVVAFTIGSLLQSSSFPAHAQSSDEVREREAPIDLGYRPMDGETHIENGLWTEDAKDRVFGGDGRVVIADIKGPGVITNIHFALGAVALSLNRDTILRIYWDGEQTPSVEAPLVDFFCDPDGAIDRVDSLLVNKLRGWNAYFAMPFAKSARVELVYDNPRYAHANIAPGHWGGVPAYSYVTYRKLKSIPADAQYFHAQWRQQTLLLGKDDYEVVRASGVGQLIGWNVTLRMPNGQTAPLDENEVIHVDGAAIPYVEWQGLEDSFGFSWNFPPDANSFPYAAYHPFYGGYAAFRFFLNDRIPFHKSLRMTIVGKGQIGDQSTKPGSEIQISSVAYWYQREPHQPFEPMLPAGAREPFAPPASPEQLAADRKHLESGETLILKCGGTKELEFVSPEWIAAHGYITHPGYVITVPQMTSEVEYLKPGWDFRLLQGEPHNDSIARIEGWPRGYWRSFEDEIKVRLLCPKGVSGTLKLYLLDGDKKGRKEAVEVAGRRIGEYQNLESGTWVEAPVSAADTADGGLPITIRRIAGPDATISEIVFVESKSGEDGQ